jgi:hypothetical protein
MHNKVGGVNLREMLGDVARVGPESIELIRVIWHPL